MATPVSVVLEAHSAVAIERIIAAVVPVISIQVLAGHEVSRVSWHEQSLTSADEVPHSRGPTAVTAVTATIATALFHNIFEDLADDTIGIPERDSTWAGSRDRE